MDSFSSGQNQGQPAPSKPDSIPNHDTNNISDDMVQRELSIRPYREFFGELPSFDEDKLDYLVRNLNPDKSLQPDEVVAKIRMIEGKLGKSMENRLHRVYRYVKMVNSSREMMLEAL